MAKWSHYHITVNTNLFKIDMSERAKSHFDELWLWINPEAKTIEPCSSWDILFLQEFMPGFEQLSFIEFITCLIGVAKVYKLRYIIKAQQGTVKFHTTNLVTTLYDGKNYKKFFDKYAN